MGSLTTIKTEPMRTDPLSGPDTHVATDWIIREASTGLVVHESLYDETNLTEYDVPSGVFVNGRYEVIVRHIGKNYGPGSSARVMVTAGEPTGEDLIFRPELSLGGRVHEEIQEGDLRGVAGEHEVAPPRLYMGGRLAPRHYPDYDFDPDEYSTD